MGSFHDKSTNGHDLSIVEINNFFFFCKMLVLVRLSKKIFGTVSFEQSTFEKAKIMDRISLLLMHSGKSFLNQPIVLDSNLSLSFQNVMKTFSPHV